MDTIRIVVSALLMIASTCVGVGLLSKSLQVTCGWRRVETPTLGRAVGITLLLAGVWGVTISVQVFCTWFAGEGVGPIVKLLAWLLVLPAAGLSLFVLSRRLEVTFREAFPIFLAIIPPGVAVGVLLVVLYAVSAAPAFASTLSGR